MHRPSVASVAILVAACGSSDPQSTGGPAGVGANNPHEAGAAESGAGGGDDQGSGSDGAAQASDDGGLGVDPLSSNASSGGTLPPLDAAPADAAPGPRTCKRGIAANAAPAAALAPSASAAGVSWWYNWASSGSGQAANIEFVPMIWGSSSIGNALPKGSTYVLGFNEPNFKSQSDLTPQQAAADWPMIETHAKAVGAKIVSPAVNYCGSASACSDPTVTDPYTYLKDFLAACTGCEVDYVAVHWYNCDLPSLQAYLEGNLDAGGDLQGFVQFGKPIWLTEFSCDGSHSVADQKAYMEAAVPYLEKNPHVFRYSWFSAGPIANAELTNSGSLTDLGKAYVGLPQNCP